MLRTFNVLLALGLILSPAISNAQSPSGPKAGEKLAALKVAVVTGSDAGKERDMAEKWKEGTAIYLLVSAERFDRPIGRFIRELDQKLIARDRRDVQVVAVWLTNDVAKSKEYLPRVQQSLQLGQTTWTVFLGDASGPQGWQIDPDRTLTIVVAKNGTAIHSEGYDSVNERLVEPTVKRALDAK